MPFVMDDSYHFQAKQANFFKNIFAIFESKVKKIKTFEKVAAVFVCIAYSDNNVLP